MRCACGALRGEVEPSRSARAACYCRDCRAYARHLGSANVLDDHGGTDIVAMHPRDIRFTDDAPLACLSLRDRGLLRWYAACCRTPIANTPRDPRVAYAGVVHTCLEQGGASLDAAFGARTMALNVKSAIGKVKATPLANVVGVLGIAQSLAAARLSRSYRDNPFFHAGMPVRVPFVLTEDQRAQAYRES